MPMLTIDLLNHWTNHFAVRDKKQAKAQCGLLVINHFQASTSFQDSHSYGVGAFLIWTISELVSESVSSFSPTSNWLLQVM